MGTSCMGLFVSLLQFFNKEGELLIAQYMASLVIILHNLFLLFFLLLMKSLRFYLLKLLFSKVTSMVILHKQRGQHHLLKKRIWMCLRYSAQTSLVARS